MLKPGLYFDMKYEELSNQRNNMYESKNIFIQKQKGLIEELKRKYARNVFIDRFVEFKNISKEKMIESEYGKIPNDYELVELKDLLEDTIGGDWGKEEPSGKNTEKIYCIRGTDIPNINVYNYSSVPIRFCKKESIKSKRLITGDIIIEISGGSPIQSTGRLCYIDKNLLRDLDAPVLCTNFCRILRFKNKEISKYVFDYLSLLYDRGYYFNLENNTTGIKNLLLNSFVQNIKVIIPKNKNIIENYYSEISKYIEENINEILKKEV